MTIDYINIIKEELFRECVRKGMRMPLMKNNKGIDGVFINLQR
jgi:hypothetical protein